MAIVRTAIVDDDGSATTGSVWNDDWKQEFYDQIDDAIAAGVASGVTQTTTSTGTQHNFALSTGAALLRANNATALTVTGLSAGAAGQPLLLVAIGAGTVALNDQDAGSSAANRFITGTGAAITLAAGTGWAALVYDATTGRWRIVGSSASAGGQIIQTTTSTGTQNDFALTAGVTLLRVNNASLVTFTGFAAGTDGQRVQIVSIGAGQVDLKHQDSGSAAANRTINPVTASISLTAGSGAAVIQYDATTARWRVVVHQQGAWITRTFAAGNYTANGSMTWTVASATTDRYSLAGRTLTFSFFVAGTIGGTLNTTVMIALPAGFVAANTQSFQILTTPASGTQQAGVGYVSGGATVVSCALNTSGTGNWTAGSGTVNGTITIEVQ